MSILSDVEIEERGLIKPFIKDNYTPGVLSYGVGSYGYDVRAGYKFKVFTDVYGQIVDPKAFDPKAFVDIDLTPLPHDWHLTPDGWCRQGYGRFRCSHCEQTTNYPENYDKNLCVEKPGHLVIPPNSFALTESIEEFDVPRDVLCVCLGKSTYARCGVIVNVTPLEPEWRGKVTIEISNTAPLPAKIYCGEGIMQVLFFRADRPCRVSYADKKGKYQDQKGLTLPKA